MSKKKKGSYRIAGAADPDATYRVHGERIDFGYNISVAATDFITIPTITPNSGDVTHHPFNAEIAHFIQCLDENVESHASIYDSYRSMAVCFAIGESAALGGQPVVVFD